MRSRMARSMMALTLAVLVGLPTMAPAMVGAQARAQEVHHGATFLFDPGISELDKYDVIEGVRLGQLAIAIYLGVPNLPNLRITAMAAGDDESDTTLATTFGSEIEVYTGSDVWQSLSQIERVETLVHELTHVYQNLMIENAVEPEPLWFAEGTADAVGFQAVIPIGVTSQDEVYNLMSYMLTTYPFTTPLSQLAGYDSMGADAYPVAYYAVQYLLGSRGLSVSAIADVYDGLAAGKTFADAFQAAFGVTLPEFYAEFEAWRPQIMQTENLDDDFWARTVTPTASPLTLDSLTAELTVGGQMMVRGTTAPDTACSLMMTTGTASVQRAAESNSQGEVYWIVSLPEGSVPGSGTLSANCGGAPVDAAFAIVG